MVQITRGFLFKLSNKNTKKRHMIKVGNIWYYHLRQGAYIKYVGGGLEGFTNFSKKIS